VRRTMTEIGIGTRKLIRGDWITTNHVPQASIAIQLGVASEISTPAMAE